jgi:DNA-directed RNA polymerase
MDNEAHLQALEQTQAATLARFNKRQDRTVLQQGYGASVGALKLTEDYLPSLSLLLADELSSQARGNNKFSTFAVVSRNLDPDVLAAAVFNALWHGVATGCSLRALMLAIGHAVHGECWAAGLLAANGKLHARIARAVKARHGNVKIRHTAARGTAKRAGYRAKDWSREEVLSVGGFCLNLCFQVLDGVLLRERGADGSEEFVTVAPEAIEIAERAVDQAITRRPVFVPVSAPPAPWSGFRRGGYWDERARFSAPVVRAYHKDTIAAINSAIRSGQMQPHLDGVNALQSVPWSINTEVLSAVQWCFDHCVPVKGLPLGEDLAEPPRLSDEAWEEEAARRLQRHRLSKVKERNRGLKSERMLFTEDMATARSLIGGPFWVPMNCDWRGRVYGVPHFNFQRDDRVRALFLFHEGAPIGVEGLWWLKVHTANCYGNGVDKVPFEQRVAWVDDNIELIKETAWDYKAQTEWWTKADKPFLFLAACVELSAALTVGPTFVTRLPPASTAAALACSISVR